MNTIQTAMNAVHDALQSTDVPPYDTRDRALWRIRFVLAAFYDAGKPGVEADTPVQDLLTDVVHLCDELNLAPKYTLEKALWMADEERKDWQLEPIEPSDRLFRPAGSRPEKRVRS